MPWQRRDDHHPATCFESHGGPTVLSLVLGVGRPSTLAGLISRCASFTCGEGAYLGKRVDGKARPSLGSEGYVLQLTCPEWTATLSDVARLRVIEWL